VSLAYNWTIWKKIIQKMWPISISIIFNVIYLKGDVVILSVLSPQEAVGVYGAAYRVLDVLTQSAMMIMGLYLPLLAVEWTQGNQNGFQKRLQQSFDAMMLLAVPLMIGTLSTATPILRLIAGKEYTDAGAGKILAILSLAVFGVYLGAIFGHSAVAINRQKQTMWVYISNAVLTLGGYLIFIPRFGIYGAAWMSVFSELYSGALLYFLVSKYSGVKLHVKTFSKILLAGIIMAGIIKILPNLNVILVSLIAAAAYAVLIFALKAISRETLKEIIRR
jgi:O-antigen/teichoic acid export membrane protein